MTATARLSTTPAANGLRKPASTRLAAGAALLIAALPVAMALANRSAPLFLLLAALVVVACVVTEAGWRGVGSGLAELKRSPVAFASAAFIGLSLISWGWSVDRTESWRTLEEGVVPLLAGAALLCFLPRVAPRWTGLAVALGVIVAALISIGELRSGMPIRKALHLRAIAFEYNRPVLTLLALFWPLCALAASTRTASHFPQASPTVLPAFMPKGASLVFWSALPVTTLAIWISQSGTAMLAKALSVAARAARLALSARRSHRARGRRERRLCFGFRLRRCRLAAAPGLDLRAPRLGPCGRWVEIWRSFGAAAPFHPFSAPGSAPRSRSAIPRSQERSRASSAAC